MHCSLVSTTSLLNFHCDTCGARTRARVLLLPCPKRSLNALETTHTQIATIRDNRAQRFVKSATAQKKTQPRAATCSCLNASKSSYVEAEWELECLIYGCVCAMRRISTKGRHSSAWEAMSSTPKRASGAASLTS
eukprot:709437-Pleurochrysis_carterae.AAC.1